MSVTESVISAGITGRSAWDPLLKTVYGPLWQIHYHTKVVVWSLRNQPKGRMGGKATLSAVIDRPPQSSGIALFEYDNMPDSDTLHAFKPEMHVKDIYSRIQITGNVIRAASRGDMDAWAAPLAKQLETSRTQLQLNLARKAYLGIYDNLGKISANYETAGTNLLTLYGRNSRTSAANSWWNFGPHYLRAGMRVWFTAANDADGDPQATMPAYGDTSPAPVYIVDNGIDSSDIDNPTIQLSGDPAPFSTASNALNAYIFPLGSRRAAVNETDMASKESDYATFNGLTNLLDDGSKVDCIYALTRSTHPTLQGVRSTQGGTQTAFDELRVDLAVDNICDNGTGTEPDKLLGHRSTRREVVKSMRSNRQMPPVVSDQGYTRLAHQSGDARLPYIVDRDCPPGMFWALDTSKGGWLTQSNLGPLDTGDSRWVSGKDAKDVLMHMSGNAYDEAPYASGTIEDIAYLTDGLTA